MGATDDTDGRDGSPSRPPVVLARAVASARRPYPQNTADAGIGTETERRFLIGLNCDWTVKADLEIGAPVSPFNPARPFYPHYHRCSDPDPPLRH
jgi:hypothetical protein